MREKQFRYLSHTADAAFVARGSSFKAALENSALALINLMLDIDRVRRLRGRVRTARINEKASTREDLVWFLLQDILSRIDERKLNAFKFKINQIKESEGACKASGCIFYKESGIDSSLMSVKAVTPHGLRIGKRGKNYAIRVVVDV